MLNFKYVILFYCSFIHHKMCRPLCHLLAGLTHVILLNRSFLLLHYFVTFVGFMLSFHKLKQGNDSHQKFSFSIPILHYITNSL